MIITNAGSGHDTPCGLENEYAVAVASGDVIDDAYFSYVCALDDADEPWEDESCWVKTNPSLPVLPGIEYLRDQVKSSRGIVGKAGVVERLNFCRWGSGGDTSLISRDVWEKCEVPRAFTGGRPAESALHPRG